MRENSGSFSVPLDAAATRRAPSLMSVSAWSLGGDCINVRLSSTNIWRNMGLWVRRANPVCGLHIGMPHLEHLATPKQRVVAQCGKVLRQLRHKHDQLPQVPPHDSFHAVERTLHLHARATSASMASRSPTHTRGSAYRQQVKARGSLQFTQSLHEAFGVGLGHQNSWCSNNHEVRWRRNTASIGVGSVPDLGPIRVGCQLGGAAAEPLCR